MVGSGPSDVQQLCVVICRPLSTYLFFVIFFVMKKKARMVITSEIRALKTPEINIFSKGMGNGKSKISVGASPKVRECFRHTGFG